MIAAFQHLFTMLAIEEIGPTDRLAAIYLVSNGELICDDVDPSPERPTRRVSVSHLAKWIGCDELDARAAIAGMASLGFSPLILAGDDLLHSLPDLPESAAEANLQPEKVLWVYVITSDAGPVKIGISRDVEQRRESLQASNPTAKLSISYRARGPAGLIRRIEPRAHEALQEHLISNEWFHVDTATAIAVVKMKLTEAGLPK